MARTAQRKTRRPTKTAQKSTIAASVEAPVKVRKRNRPEYGSDAVAELLSRYGFEYAFLNPGSSYRGLQDSLVNYNANQTPKVVLGLHEDVVVALAQGYATASGKPALCILHNLVGLLHGAMGVFNLYCSGQPALILGGSGPSDIDLRGPVDYLHSANTQGEVVRSFVKWDDEATTVDGVLDSIVRGYKIANTGPKGPVYIAFDSGLQEQELDKPISVHDIDQSCFQAPPPPAAREDVIEEAAEMLMKARYPLIIGGRLGYTPDATKPIKDLVELLGAAYRDDRTFVCMPTAHKQNLTGSREVLGKADVVLAIDCADVRAAVNGYRGDWQSYKTPDSSRQKVIDLSLNETSNRTWNRVGGAMPDTALQVLADPMTGLEQLIAAVRKKRRSAKGFADRAARRVKSIARDKAALVKAQEALLKKRWDENPISPQRMVAELWALVRRKDWYLTLRNHRSWPEGVWKFDGAGQYMGHSSGGGLGHGPGASVGAGFACMADGRFPVAIIGDGDFLMGMSAVWTAVHYKVPLLIVINNNTSWYNDEEHQFNVAKMRGRPPENAYIGTTTRDPEVDLAKVSEAHGAVTFGPITEPGDLKRTFSRAVKVVTDGGVAVVDVRTSNL